MHVRTHTGINLSSVPIVINSFIRKVV
nr:unnamed protein product [Callosobruchus analis]